MMGLQKQPVSELVMARRVRAAVCRVRGIAEMSAGRWVESATYGPGETVRGVAVSGAHGAWELEIHVMAVYADTISLVALADRVRHTAQRAVQGLSAAPIRHIHIAIDDLQLEGEWL